MDSLIFYYEKMVILFFPFWILSINAYSQSTGTLRKKNGYFLIAHRGGVIDSTNTEDSGPPIEAAIRTGYDMIEVDLRLTKDSIFIIQHDATFKRYYGVNKSVSSMTWNEISKLRSSNGGSKVIKFEDVLKICQGKMQLMIDNKIRGRDTVLFTKLLNLLRRYKLLSHAMMIGTEESTPFFTGKIKLSCTRKQLESNMEKPGYSSGNYYLFEIPQNLSVSDVEWAKNNDIQVVAVINGFRYFHSDDPVKESRNDINKMISEGVRCFQIDSKFDAPFFY